MTLRCPVKTTKIKLPSDSQWPEMEMLPDQTYVPHSHLVTHTQF